MLSTVFEPNSFPGRWLRRKLPVQEKSVRRRLDGEGGIAERSARHE
jgi:hypothetical protein